MSRASIQKEEVGKDLRGSQNENPEDKGGEAMKCETEEINRGIESAQQRELLGQSSSHEAHRADRPTSQPRKRAVDSQESRISASEGYDTDNTSKKFNIFEVDQLGSKLAKDLAEKTKQRLGQLRGQVKTKGSDVVEGFKKKKSALDRYMKSAKAVKFLDKISFVFGITLSGMTCFILGKYPDDLYYVWHNLVVLFLVLCRMIIYITERKRHYYLVDFCYFANVLIALFHCFYPKDERLFVATFMHATGPLAVATGAFSNSLVFHSIDHLTSLAIHVIPMVSVWNLRWSTLPSENANEYYLNMSLDYSPPLLQVITDATLTYLVWAIPYSALLFSIKYNKIKERKYDCLFMYCAGLPVFQPLLDFGGRDRLPLIFMTGHFIYYLSSVLIAYVCFHFFYLHSIWMLATLYISFWNGASFYMDYFAKKYQYSLEKLQQLESQIEAASSSSKEN